MKEYHNNNDTVKLRQGIAMVLQEGIRKVNNNEGTDFFKRALIRISTFPQYEVITNYSGILFVNGKSYGGHDNTILIKEDGKRMFVIYKDKYYGTRETELDFNPFDLMEFKHVQSHGAESEKDEQREQETESVDT